MDIVYGMGLVITALFSFMLGFAVCLGLMVR